ncbi:MAG: HD domain-containing protein [Spirochaetia bacterium]|nr:HD domain-containing protein [Spirochaetia bacterium]
MNNVIDSSILKQRVHPKKEDARGAYFRDTTAIIHSYPFRRLKHKTQVFFAPSNDHICTRIEHVMHVASIAASISKGLGLDDELAWAIGMGHDLGHTPFGHVGETILNTLNRQNGGFIHEVYSLRVVDYLAEYGKGLNLTYAVRDGIISHCGEKFEQYILPDQRPKNLEAVSGRDSTPSTWEGAVVRIADKIAYLGRDYEDAVKLRVITNDSLPESIKRVLGSTNGEIINNLVHDVIVSSGESRGIGFSDDIFEGVCKMKEHNYERIYKSPLLSEYHTYFERIMRIIYEYLEMIFSRNGFNIIAYKKEKNLLAVRFGDYVIKMRDFYERIDGNFRQIVSDYVAGMSDNYALDSINEILQPRYMENQFNRFEMER